MNILVADDELSMLKIIEAYLKKEKFNVLTASDGEEALEKFYENKIDLAILDWMMPNIDGIEVCKQIKEKSDTKVMMLTAKGQVDDEIDALNIGADDYIKKPFDPRLLIIRVKKLIGYNDIFKLKNLKVDLKQQKAFKDDKDLGLTKTEFELLKTLVNNKGSILPREKLLDLVWGMDYYGDLRTVDTHIRRLRSKIGEEYITTHRGLGYCLEDIND
ncbi:response regulator transcription factor [Paraclostridium sordellii]|uniref:response regulator transcription factor n=1 Tax=Paraclostridium sordellii TaxID=1505 RepID=UPI0005E296D2|nr:response regulator transcription factor [Paeniclostridium sordellii]CEN82971.1 DNA-binding response regulator [[Clostridium] sordellii] [Paeniclostridium sordellii]CEN87966.1 DNA-binding response regulator [[Clostridium] sordellii] [Paeniclostridium sordellii]CEO06117.1 DNA-binding response regulator [[Clostridium] sordellii] [Paeniclostridium sordellii]CEO22373.1 DNA-binding response regulator [[Clostridium] sordellii] [Paeniclostridium sordellii]CEP86382.1 DNA-binding response regulator [